MIITGRLHSLDQTERIITIKHKKDRTKDVN